MTRFGCVGFSMYACGFFMPQMRQFCLFIYPPRSKWASSEKMIFFANIGIIFVRRKDRINYLSNQTWAKCYRKKHVRWRTQYKCSFQAIRMRNFQIVITNQSVIFLLSASTSIGNCYWNICFIYCTCFMVENLKILPNWGILLHARWRILKKKM